jgi:hypothetical protein
MYVLEVLHGFLQLLQATAMIVPEIRLRQLPSASFAVH